MNTINYKVYDVLSGDTRIDSINGVYGIRILDKYVEVSYLDGDAHHTRLIPTILLETFEVS